jgi:hypothetical protein
MKPSLSCSVSRRSWSHLCQAIGWVYLAALPVEADVEQPALRADGTATTHTTAHTTILTPCRNGMEMLSCLRLKVTE